MAPPRPVLTDDLRHARRGVLYLLAACVVIAWGLGHVIRIHDVVYATGEVVAESSMTAVLTQEGGSITQIFAAVGDHLDKDAPLLALDPNFSADKLATLQRQLSAQRDEKKRIDQALQVVTQIVDNPETIRNDAARTFGVVGDSFSLINELYTARLDLDNASAFRKSNVTSQKEQISSEIALVERSIDLLKRNLEFSKKEAAAREAALTGKRNDFAALLKLADKGLVSGTDVNRERDGLLQAELSVTETHKQVDQLELDISNRSLHISELKIRADALGTDANNRLAAARWQYDMRLARLGEHKASLERTLHTLTTTIEASIGKLKQGEGGAGGAVVVTMPTAGLLTRLHFATPGASVKAGATVATVLPEGNQAFVLAHLANKDVGFVRPGGLARVKVDAYPYAQFGTLEARVTRVFPDPEGPTFVVKLALSRATIDVHGVAAPLFPGLQVHVDLLTRERRLADMLLHR